MALTPEEIRAKYAKRRTKGAYVGYTDEFLQMGEAGIDVKEQWPELRDKKAQTIKQGFENWKKNKEAPEGAQYLDIIVDGEEVFLMNKQLVGELAGASA